MPHTLLRIYERLFEAYGPQHWWPGDTPEEIIIGAILTQNTNWKNVERAIDNLKSKDSCHLSGIRAMPRVELADCIRPAGYFNVKARRLQAVAESLDMDYITQLDVIAAREKLLSMHGIGPETADSILLYAFDKPTFVVDAYTKRIFSRMGMVDVTSKYEVVRRMFMDALPCDVRLYNEYHALIVRHAKEHCRVKPVCEGCVLREGCSYYLQEDEQ